MSRTNVGLPPSDLPAPEEEMLSEEALREAVANDDRLEAERDAADVVEESDDEELRELVAKLPHRRYLPEPDRTDYYNRIFGMAYFHLLIARANSKPSFFFLFF